MYSCINYKKVEGCDGKHFDKNCPVKHLVCPPVGSPPVVALSALADTEAHASGVGMMCMAESLASNTAGEVLRGVCHLSKRTYSDVLSD